MRYSFPGYEGFETPKLSLTMSTQEILSLIFCECYAYFNCRDLNNILYVYTAEEKRNFHFTST